MRADGGSIVSVHGDSAVAKPGVEDTELRALLDLPTVRSHPWLLAHWTFAAAVAR
jgi:hypothetical protein|eukprot:COSAG06_NODE_11164_length_1553_cov_1.706327_3_plen_55_part_00